MPESNVQLKLEESNFDAARDQGWLTPLCADDRLAISTRLVGAVIARQFFSRKQFGLRGKLIAWCTPVRIVERCGGGDYGDGIGLSTVYAALIELEAFGYIIPLTMAGLIDDKPNKKVKAMIGRPQQRHARSNDASNAKFQNSEKSFQESGSKIPESGRDSIESNLKPETIDPSISPSESDAAREARWGADWDRLTREQKRQRVLEVSKRTSDGEPANSAVPGSDDDTTGETT